MSTTLQAMYDRTAAYAVGVDIGGTKINLGIVRTDGHIVMERQLPALQLSEETMERISNEIAEMAKEFYKQYGAEAQLRGIGVGSTGHIDTVKGEVRSRADRMSIYQGTPIRGHLEAALQLPVLVDNDVNVLALTEKYFGAGRNVRHMLCLALGTGVGGAMLVNGRLVHGAWGGAGEVGHFSVNFNGPRCNCGLNGCLELYASGTGIARRMNEKLAHIGRGEAGELDAKETIRRWLANEDDAAMEVVDEAITALSSALASLIHLYNPEVIVIGGGVAEVGAPLLDKVRAATQSKTIPSFYETVRMTGAYRGNRAGMIGAAMLHWEYEQTK